jgi:DtxR family Mn-dependent transcriptional regulator
VARLITDMESQNLLETHGSELHLTTEGERWAMHVVRAHRLWERYLADEARLPLEKIHDEAHRREHSFTDAQLDDLDAALGHPSFDPHGDPIPSREGKLPLVESVLLTAWQDDDPARIVHIEDEPSIAYEQILAAGLRLGQVIRIIGRTSQRYVLSDGESEYRLAPTVAANVSVAPLAEMEIAHADSIPLTDLSENRRAEIVMLDEAVQGFTRRRFLDLGLTPGTTIYPELQNFFGDPRAYRVRGTLIALRKNQAAQIWVKPV